MIYVGQKITLGWNGAKYFSEYIAHQDVRVEAVGVDWIVVRDREGCSWATGFPPEKGHTSILEELES